MAEKKEKRYVSDNTQLMAEWDWNKNNELGLDPTTLTYKSGKYAYWKCKICSRSWRARIAERTAGKGCKSCSAKEVNERAISKKIKTKGSLFELAPALANEWHPTKNLEIKPQDVTPQSNKKVWWLGKCGHEWQATISHRFGGRGCPFCAGQKVLEGFNDLASQYPHIAAEWNYERNSDIFPNNITDHSGKKVWWKCEKGHEWESTIASRCEYNLGCPECSKGMRTSFPESVIYFYIKKYFNDTIWSYKGKELNGVECDIYIPQIKVGIEYDGGYWHKNILRDKSKDNLCKRCGISLIRVREPKTPIYESTALFYRLTDLSEKSLEQTIIRILKSLSIKDPDVNIAKDYANIQNLITHAELENSLETKHPELICEWNWEKNGDLTPKHISSFSNKKVWWKCKLGHEWQASISNRTKGRQCPVCAGKKVLHGFNDFAFLHPELLNEWDYNKNKILPTEVTVGYSQKVWWICDKGHKWEAAVSTRIKGHNCPYCQGLYASSENNLAISNPTLAMEWNHKKNLHCFPEATTPNSSKKVWWICSNCGHEWEATVYHRNSRGQGCPKCAKQKRKKVK